MGIKSPLYVLYLEDNPVDADLARRSLAGLAPTVGLEVVGTVAAAKERLAAPTPPYDVVLTDLKLPDGSGLDLLTHIRELGLPLAVVVITGSGDQEAAVAALKAGADDYLVKKSEYLSVLPRVLSAAHGRFQTLRERRSRSLRVLYAEPNVFDADLTRRYLAQYASHIHLDVVGSGAEVLTLLKTGGGAPPPFDVLLLDYQLPGLNALEVVKTHKQEQLGELPIVLVTGQGNEEVAVRALRLGVDDYLVKRDGYLQRLPVVLENVQKQAELNRAESRYRNLFASMRDVIIIADLDRIILDANQPALRTLFGYEIDEIRGRSTNILYADPNQFAYTGREIFNNLDSGAGKLLEANYRKKSGGGFTAEVFALKMLNDRGDTTGNIGVIRDVTERKQAEQERQKLIVELERRNAELERFTYTVSHDLKSPLVTILGFAGQLEQDLLDNAADNIQDDLTFIRNAAGQMSELLDNLLQLSRAGRAIGEPRPVNLDLLVQRAVEQVGHQLSRDKLRVDIPDTLPVVNGDPIRLCEVFQNLLENAVKFSRDAVDPLIEIDCRRGDGEVVCFVRDNGIGLAAEYQERIFGLFEQLDPGKEGTGIGLAIVRRIVEEHGGRVWVESAGTGQGSTFFITLPIASQA